MNPDSLARLRRAVVFRISICLLLAAAGAALFAGCAGAEQYRAGKEFLAAGEYDRAIGAFREAVAQDPQNTDYRMSLAEAESLAADEHVEKAEKLLARHRATAARSELQIAMEQMPGHPRGIGLVGTVEKEIRLCEGWLEKARAALARKDWAEAARLADEAGKVDESHPELQQVRAEALAGVIADHLARGEKALQARNWEACTAACAEVKALDSSNAAAAALERKAGDRKESLRLLESAAPLVSKADYLGAVGPLRQAAALWPENEDITARLEKVTASAIDGMISRIEAEVAAGRFAAGLQALDRALSIFPSREVLIKRRPQILNRWSAALLDEYKHHASAGDWELAWPPAVQAAALSTSIALPASQACIRAEQAIRKEIAYNLSALPLKSSTAGMDTALAACGILLDQLGRIRPDHVHLLKPANLPEVLAEHDLSPADITDPEKLAALARQLGGTDIVVFVDVAAHRTDLKSDGSSPGVHRARRGVTIRVHLRLVEVATGRILWSDNQASATAVDARTPIEPNRPRGVTARTAALKDDGKLQAEAIDKLKPLLRAKAEELLKRRSAVYWEDAQKEAGEQAVADYVWYLFDCTAWPDRHAVESALEGIFGPHQAGERLARCKQIAIERLNLQFHAAAADQPESTVASARHPATASAVSPAPARPGPVAMAKPVPKASAAAAPPPAPAQPAAPAPPRQTEKKPTRVFHGTVSRDDDRYPKELTTIDGIIVKVKDTDEDPLDADLEIRVGSFKTRYKDQPVGARITGRGESGRRYQVVILAIEDDEETVHFAIEAMGVNRR